MVKMTLKLRAGKRLCGDRQGICRLHYYMGGFSGERIYHCALFAEPLKIDKTDKYERTLRLKACREAEKQDNF